MTDQFGGVDVWIANAGVSREDKDITKLDPAAWREVIDVNLTGTFLGARAAAARMGPGGRIIVTGSVLGDRPHGRLAAYSASKGGIHALVRSLAQELGPRAITANAVALGWFDTGLGAYWQRDAARARDRGAHRARPVGDRRPTSPASTCSSPRPPRPTSPAPRSPLTAATRCCDPRFRADVEGAGHVQPRPIP